MNESSTTSPAPRMTYLDILESESIHIMREVAASAENPVLLYSVGKDSSVLAHLARKAFHPGKIPFPFLHVDTSYKFPEMIAFRDETCERIGADLIVEQNAEALADGANPWDLGTRMCCSLLKTHSLVTGLAKAGFDAAIGGARRDEEKSRAKERIFSFRDEAGQWDPRNQRPELWNVYVSRINKGESFRVFPLSNWTEMDIWHYIHRESIPIVHLYFAQERDVLTLGEQLILPDLVPAEHRHRYREERVVCRFRTLGCSPCTGAIRSSASSVEEIIEEMISVTQSERANRVIDHDAESSMEEKKREGYF